MRGPRVGLLIVAFAFALTGAAIAAPTDPAAWGTSLGGATQNPSRDYDPGITPDLVWSHSFTGNPSVQVLADNGTAYLTYGDASTVAIDAVDMATGALRWTKSYAGFSHAACTGEGRFVSTTQNVGATAYDSASGSVLWTAAFNGPCLTTPTAVVFHTSSTGLAAVDPLTGGTLWTATVSPILGEPVATAGRVVVRHAGGNFTALNLMTGTVAWTKTFAGTGAEYTEAGGLVADGDTVFGSTERGGLISMKAADGDTNFSTTVDGRGPVTVDANRIYMIPVPLQKPVAFTRATGAPVWTSSDTHTVLNPLLRIGPRLYPGAGEFIYSAATGGLLLDLPAGQARDRIVYGTTTLKYQTFAGGGVVQAFRDLTGPSSQITAPASVVAVKRPALTWTASDGTGSGLDAFDVTIDGQVVATDLPDDQRAYVPQTDLTEGSHTWTLKAVDAAANTTTTAPRAFIVDTVAPPASALGPPADAAANLPGSQAFTWVPSDDGANGSGVVAYDLIVDGQVAATVQKDDCAATCGATVNDLGQGNHTWGVRATDAADLSTTSAARAFTVDVTPPAAFALTTPAADAHVADSTPTLTWAAATDAGAGLRGYRVVIDGTPAGSEVTATEFTPADALSDGNHVWSVRAFDLNGNVGESDSHTFTVDTTAPDTSADGAAPPAVTRKTSLSTAFSSPDASATFECRQDDGSWNTCTSPLALSNLVAGPHTLDIRAEDEVGNLDATPASLAWQIDRTTPPVADVTAGPVPASTGQTVTFDAGASRDPFDGTIVSYAWDLDGDGTFEIPAGPAAVTSRTYTDRTTPAAHVRVTNDVGGSAVATVAVDVRSTPPAGRLGVSINSGAQYTNDPNVTVAIVWPLLAAQMVLSNDGGFAAPLETPVAAVQPWTLDSAGAERIPKTLYVRFEGGSSGRETYTDDIILDQTAPTVSASASRPGEASGASIARAKKYALRITARDKTSGVAAMQIAKSRAKPPKFTKYKRRASLRSPGRKAYVRVRDRADNVSAWRTVRLR